MSVVALDIGGANLKAADGRDFAASQSFPLWKSPQLLAKALADLLAMAPRADAVVVTMTGELADCFVTKADGVSRIVAAAAEASRGRNVYVYLTDGTFVPPAEAVARPLEAAASNWHALARLAGGHAPAARSLLIDVGSTTTDIIPIDAGRPAATGRTDPERLLAGELVYTGVERTPVCAVVRSVRWRGQMCPVAAELFATVRDAWLLLDELPQDAKDTHTADGRPATKAAARDRLARMLCADSTMFTQEDALNAALAIAAAQVQLVAQALEQVSKRMASPPAAVVLSGQGEFLAARGVKRALPSVRAISLGATLGPRVSRVAPAHALALLAREAGLG